MQQHGCQMAALASIILDINQTPQQTAEMNPFSTPHCHILHRDMRFIKLNCLQIIKSECLLKLEDIFRTEKWQLPEDAANAAWREDKGANFGPKSDKSKRAACSGSRRPQLNSGKQRYLSHFIRVAKTYTPYSFLATYDSFPSASRVRCR